MCVADGAFIQYSTPIHMSTQHSSPIHCQDNHHVFAVMIANEHCTLWDNIYQ